MEAKEPALHAGRPGPWRGTVRTRTTGAAVLVAGIALALASVALVAALRQSLTREVRAVARLRAFKIAAAVESSGNPKAVALPAGDEQIVQILSENGLVVASSQAVEDRPALASLRPGESKAIYLPGDDDPFITVAAAAKVGREQFTVMAGSLNDITGTTQNLTNLLIAGVPLLMVVIGLTTFKVVGRALAPVEDIRSEVEAISGAQLHRRVPMPLGSDEISKLASTMNRMLDRLQDSQTSQRQFVSDASHELRSPVASIRQHAEVALAHPERTSVGELAETVMKENLRVQQLIQDLFILARADEKTLPVEDEAVDLDDLVFEEAGRLRESTQINVDTSSVSAGRVRGDKAHLRRMVRNLADNASRHAREKVTFTLGDHDEFVVLIVDDDGAGIPTPERERIFERFVRLDDSRTRDRGGSGLGLAIVNEIAAAHGGTVTAAESPAGGARLKVRLPRAPD